MAQDVFTTVGSHTWQNPGVSEVEVLVVGGGGGGGSFGGGGGGGGVVHYKGSVSGDKSVTVGAGGLGNDNYKGGVNGENGDDSSFGSMVAKGGGGGGSRNGSAQNYSGNPGNDGGSGGGGSHSNVSPEPAPGSSTQQTYSNATVYGNSGGYGAENGNYSGGDPDHAGGGGGGAGQVGDDAVLGEGGGEGGDGVDMSAIFGTTYGENGWFGGGGGGMTYKNVDYQAPGGTGGGGNGSSINPTISATDGMANTGGGGGSGNTSDAPVSGDGGSGIVIVKYENTPAAPDNADATYVDDDEIDFSFDADTSGGPISSYDVEINRDGSGWQVPTGGPSSISHDGSASYTKSYGPNSDSSYGSQVGIDSSFQFRVRAVGTNGDASPWSYSDTVYTTPVPPHNPSVTRPDANTIRITGTVQSDIAGFIKVGYREDTGSGYGAWTFFDDAVPGESQIISGSVDTKGQSFTLEYNIGTAYQNGTLVEDARYQFRIRTGTYYSVMSDWVYADYGNNGNVFFEDDFESGDFSNWSNTAGSPEVKSGSVANLGISGPDSGTYYAYGYWGEQYRKDFGDLSSETDVIVKAVVATHNGDGGSLPKFEWYDGSGWNTISEWDWEYNRQGWFEVSILVPDSLLSTDNRFRVEVDGGSDNELAVDRVVVSDILHEYTKPASSTNPSLDTSVENEITVSWTHNATHETAQNVVHRPTSSSSWTYAQAPADATSWTNYNLSDGEAYEYETYPWVEQFRRGSHDTYFDATRTSMVSGTTVLPAPSGFSIDDIDGDTYVVSFAGNHDYGDLRVYVSTDGGSTWVDDSGSLARSTISYTTTALSSADEHTLKVQAETEHTTTSSSTVTEVLAGVINRRESGAVKANESGVVMTE